ncbi:MAG: hypothetical protein ROW52_12405 [Anaerolineaceae bacterium]|jgi:hypothetical protein
MIIAAVLNDKRLVSLDDSGMSPAAIVRGDKIISDVRPIGVWLKFLYGWESGGEQEWQNDQIASQLLTESRKMVYIERWFGKE